jgi:hypothetical protein
VTDVSTPTTTADVPAASDVAGREDARPPYRLRDLRGNERWIALAAFVLLAVPFVVALVRAYRGGWVPSGDEANIATRALDVFSKHPPLTGLPSTSFLYGAEVFTYHPGPIEFYLLAIPLRVLGMTTGPLLTAVAINGAWVCIALWVFFRRLGFGAMLWASVLLQAVMWSAGTSILTDTLLSNMTMYSALATAVLAWAISDGDYRLLPLGAFVGSYGAQQHLATTLLVAVLVVYACVSLAVVLRRAKRRDPEHAPAVRKWVYAGVGVGLLCWLPPIVDEIKGRPGNFTAIWDFARDNNRATLGWGRAFRQMFHAITPPTVLGRTDTNGSWFIGHVTLARGIVGVLMLVALALVVWWFRRERTSVARLGVITFVVLVAGLFTGSNVPESVEMFRANLYRWTWTAAFLMIATLGIAIALLLRRVGAVRAPNVRVQRLAPVALLLVAALVAGCTASIRGADDTNREAKSWAFEKRAAKAILARIHKDKRIQVTISGHAALTTGGHLIFRLVQAGVPVRLQPSDAIFLGRHRRIGKNEHVPAIVVQSGGEDLPTPPGQLLARGEFDPTYTRLADKLVAQAKRGPVEKAPNADQVIDEKYGRQAREKIIEPMFRDLGKSTRAIVTQPVFLQLVLDGVLRSPSFDRGDVQAMLDAIPHRKTVLGDERIQVSLLTADELVQYRREIHGG